jgi:hypothetical protein
MGNRDLPRAGRTSRVARRTRIAVTAPRSNRLGKLERRSEHRTHALAEPTAGRFRFSGRDEQRGGRQGTNQEQTFHGTLLEEMNESETNETG